MKEIDRLLDKVERGINTEPTRDELGLWISESNILNLIFEMQHHHLELIKRSENILKILCRSQVHLSSTQMDLIWGLIHRDDQTWKEIINVLTEVGVLLEDYNKDFLVDKILSDLSLINLPMMNLLKRFSTNQKVEDFYWEVLRNVDSYSVEMLNFVFEQLSKQVKQASLKDKLHIIKKCISLLKEDKAGIQIIKIIRSTFKDKLTISKLYELQEDFWNSKTDLIEAFFINFTSYMDLAHGIY